MTGITNSVSSSSIDSPSANRVESSAAELFSTSLRSSTATELKADFSITLQSESTATLNATFQRLMDAIHAIPGLSIRGPIRLPKDGKIHSRRVDIKSIPERQLRAIGEQAEIKLSEGTGEETIQENGVIVTFDIE
ncbi:hypothetical protein BGX28_002406 [Mortierella sp. GBA30]|nr:hypothetical protein BGX28_002406 [Mortierella sp. GBA30]